MRRWVFGTSLAVIVVLSVCGLIFVWLSARYGKTSEQCGVVAYLVAGAILQQEIALPTDVDIERILGAIKPSGLLDKDKTGMLTDAWHRPLRVRIEVLNTDGKKGRVIVSSAGWDGKWDNSNDLSSDMFYDLNAHTVSASVSDQEVSKVPAQEVLHEGEPEKRYGE
jgi:hypothetical protein